MFLSFHLDLWVVPIDIMLAPFHRSNCIDGRHLPDVCPRGCWVHSPSVTLAQVECCVGSMGGWVRA